MKRENNRFNGERLKEARQFNAMSISDLADATKLSRQAISQYENGKAIPEIQNALNLSRTLKFPFSYFFQEGTLSADTATTYFRSLTSTLKKDRKSQVIRMEYVAKIFEILCNYVEFPKFIDPEVNFDHNVIVKDFREDEIANQIEDIAAYIRRIWNIEDGPIENLQYTLESHGVVVTGFESEENRIDAFSQKTDIDGETIYLVGILLGTRPECRIRLDMAHELGHILLHPWGEDIEELTREEFRNREGQANMFASAFLLPADSFGEDVSYYPTDLNYYEFLKKKWGVSIQAMIVRAYQLKIITANQYQYLMRQVSKNGWRKKEPGDRPYMLESSVFQGAIDILLENKVFTAEGLMETFEMYGVVMYPMMVEELLMLSPGTLNYHKEGKVIPVVKIKEDIARIDGDH